MDDIIQVYTTTATSEDAQAIADAVLEQRVAGCVQIVGPIRSAYWWNGKIERAEEWLCIMKSHRRLFPDLERVVRAQHPYETPEIIAVPVVEASQPYLRWLNQELKPA